MQSLAAPELLEDARRYGRTPLGGLQVLDEDLDGTTDPDQSHRLTRLVEHQGQLRMLTADLPQDLLGERGRLGHGDRRELPYLDMRYVVPRRARHHGRRWCGHGVNSPGPLART